MTSMKAGKQGAEQAKPPLGHRERKKQRVKAQLTEVALSLFSERGFEQTTVDDIASAVDLVPRTFFRYFRSKDDALFSWFEVMGAEARKALLARPHGEGALRALIEAGRQVMETHGAQERVVLILRRLDATSPELHMRQAVARYDMQRQLAQTLASRLEPSATLVAEMVTAIASTAWWFAVDEWAAEGASRPLREYSESIYAKELTLFHDIDKRYVLR
jgi:AcrR family transcriptional regulator